MKAPQGCGQVFNVPSRIPKRVSRRKSPCLIPYMTGLWKVIERREPMSVCNARVWEISEPKSQAGVFHTIEPSTSGLKVVHCTLSYSHRHILVASKCLFPRWVDAELLAPPCVRACE